MGLYPSIPSNSWVFYRHLRCLNSLRPRTFASSPASFSSVRTHNGTPLWSARGGGRRSWSCSIVWQGKDRELPGTTSFFG